MAVAFLQCDFGSLIYQIGGISATEGAVSDHWKFIAAA